MLKGKIRFKLLGQTVVARNILNVLIFSKNARDCPEKVTLISAWNGKEIAAYFEMTKEKNFLIAVNQNVVPHPASYENCFFCLMPYCLNKSVYKLAAARHPLMSRNDSAQPKGSLKYKQNENFYTIKKLNLKGD